MARQSYIYWCAEKMNNRFIILTVDYPPMPAGMAQHCHDIALALKLNGDCPEVIAPALPSKLPQGDTGMSRLSGLKPSGKSRYLTITSAHYARIYGPAS